MSDLISRQAAIDAMNTRLEDIKLTWRGKVKKGEIAMYLDMRGVIETLPSAQPEVRTEMSSADDTISRTAAIDALMEILDRPNHAEFLYTDEICKALKALPSAQPEIVRCKECKWWDKKDGSPVGYCHAAKHGCYSEHWEIEIYRTYKEDFYCADGEREGEE